MAHEELQDSWKQLEKLTLQTKAAEGIPVLTQQNVELEEKMRTLQTEHEQITQTHESAQAPAQSLTESHEQLTAQLKQVSTQQDVERENTTAAPETLQNQIKCVQR